VLIDQPSEDRSQRDGGQVRPPKSPDYENLTNAPPDNREASYRPAGDDHYYNSEPGITGAYQGSTDSQANSPVPNSTTNGPSKFNLDRGPPPLDYKGSSVNGSDLDEDYDDRLSRNAAGKGHDPAKAVPSYVLNPNPNPNHKQEYLEPTVATNQDPYEPYSEFMNRGMSMR
jgi:hypothetical protein